MRPRSKERPPTTRWLAPAGVLSIVLAAGTAGAAPSKVALLGPSGAPVLPRLERNVAAMKLATAPASVTLCSRDVITRLMKELQADAAICTDGDQIGVWTQEGERPVLKEAVVLSGDDARHLEIAAAQAVLALQAPEAKEAPPRSASGFTIVASGSDATVTPGAAATAPAEPVAKDVPDFRPPAKAPERVAPRLILAAGPGMVASRHGSSFAMWAGAEVGVGRYVSLVPWVQFVPANRTVEAPLGTASFRPTTFGLGFDIPILPHSSRIVPRIGSGYGIVWMHVSPETASAPATARAPEDLLAPMMYATAAISVKVASSFRITGEGMGAVASHDMVVRIGGQEAAHWGVPMGSLSLRGEWVLQ